MKKSEWKPVFFKQRRLRQLGLLVWPIGGILLGLQGGFESQSWAVEHTQEDLDADLNSPLLPAPKPAHGGKVRHPVQSQSQTKDQANSDVDLEESLESGDVDDLRALSAMSQKMHEQMVKHLEKGMAAPFQNDLGFSGLDKNAGEMTRREDDEFIYYDVKIRGLKSEKVSVKVEKHQINISGKIEERTKVGSRETFSQSSFQRSFSTPPGVKVDDVQIQQKENLLTLKFPKIKPHE